MSIKLIHKEFIVVGLYGVFIGWRFFLDFLLVNIDYLPFDDQSPLT